MDAQTETHIHDAGTVAQTVHTQGEYVAHRDLYIQQDLKHEDSRFSEVNLVGYQDYLPPLFSTQVKDQLKHHGVLILAGGQGFDKGSFARYVAYQLGEELKYTTIEAPGPLENQALYKQLRKSKEETIYLIDQAHPQHLDYDLDKFIDLAHRRDLHLLITTDLPLSVWRLKSSTAQDIAFEIPVSDLYDLEILAQVVKDRLHAQASAFEAIVPAHGMDVATGSLMGYSAYTLAKKLETPERIQFFLRLLQKESKELTQNRLDELLNQVLNSDLSLVAKWFQTLDRREKIVALGVALLEGMYDDQYFKSMELFAKEHWQFSDVSLRALDYEDLEFALPYFKLEVADEEKQIIRNRFANQRTDIIRTAWATHRRHILNVLPQLVGMVQESKETKSLTEWERFGTRDRRMNLRASISKTLSDLGLVSIPAVENYLIELAAQQDELTQRVVAKAMARWREFEKDEVLFSVLDRWIHDEHAANVLEQFLLRRKTETDAYALSNKAHSYLKATAMMTLSYAANYDSPNQLHPTIVEHMVGLAQEANGPLLRRINEALPRLVHHHILQLKDVLMEKLIPIDGLQNAIGSGLASAYEEYPQDLKVTLDHWLHRCVQDASKDNRRQKFTYRDKVVATLLKTYEEFEWRDNPEEGFTLKEVFERVYQLHAIEGRASLRKDVLETLGKLMPYDWDLAATYLPKIVKRVYDHEAEVLADKIFGHFLEERKQLQGGQAYAALGGVDFPLWANVNRRPFTQVEKALLTWTVSGNKLFKQVATLALLKIAQGFELAEIQLIRETNFAVAPVERQPSVAEGNPESAMQPMQKRLVPTEPYLSWFLLAYIRLWLLFESRSNRKLLQAFLRILVHYRHFDRREIQLVLLKWKRSGDALMIKMAKWIPRFSKWIARAPKVGKVSLENPTEMFRSMLNQRNSSN